jgi:hypothetical protein
MKKLLAVLFLFLTSSVQAQHGHGHHGHYHGSGRWVVPAIIGAGAVYLATRPVPPPVYYYYPNALPPAPYGYHYEQILDANCNCYRWVLVQG